MAAGICKNIGFGLYLNVLMDLQLNSFFLFFFVLLLNDGVKCNKPYSSQLMSETSLFYIAMHVSHSP